MNKVKTAIFPVGGLGTRFLPATKSMPKEMLPVVDKPLIQYAYEEAKECGIEKFIFITGRNKNIISNHFDHSYELQRVLDDEEKTHLLEIVRDWLPPAGNIAFIRQQEPLGLGHAINCARNFIKQDEAFVVILADEMFIPQTTLLHDMLKAYNKFGGNIIGVADIIREDSIKYGIIDPIEDNGKIIKIGNMVEKPSPRKAPSTISVTGRYILQPEIFKYLEKGKQDKNKEIQLTDAIAATIGKIPCHGVRFSGRRFDCGNRRGWLEANIAFALEREDMRDDVIKILKRVRA